MGIAQRINDIARRVPPGVLYLLAPLPAAWWLYLGLTGGLGVEPIKELEHRLGEFALQLLIAGLCVTPLREFFGVSLIKFRRAIGLIAFTYVVLHLLVWLVLDMSVLWEQILRDIAKRPYITIGMASFALLIPLALTSNNLSIRKLGPVGWRRLHKLTYVAVALGAVHFVMLTKGWQLEPLIYLTIVTALLALRLKPRQGVMSAARLLKGRQSG
ncbi:MAG: protein-methionine-sulfoxide reductase heme-binding subunit MsrQ [Rhodobacter sp.]|nr:protein-methionine-sulfoxide reductase heme-binding subunit MsrQ [Rhodobacter sp.]